jgi:signal transduction histidine kinase
MQKVEDGDLSVRVISKRKDEIGRLANSLNSMLSELEKARHEIQRCHMEQLKRIEMMASLGELATAVAHEIKNPLAGISGAIQVMSEDLQDNEPRKEIINDVLKEIERLDRTVRNLLSFAKPGKPNKEEVSIRTMIESVINLIKSRAEKQLVHIKFDSAEDVQTVVLDPQQIQQAILNIALNALNVMPDGGTLSIGVSQRHNKMEISLTDTGPGVGVDDLKNIFKPFYTTKPSGTGLGLAISRSIIEAHGGEIAVESNVGVETTFRIYLPV